MQIAGTQLGLASEGSFTASFGPVVEQMEILLFVDDDLGLELVEGTLTTSSPSRAGARLPLPTKHATSPKAVDFPVQGVILQAQGEGRISVYKDFTDIEHLRHTTETLLGESSSLIALPDHRAHRSPSRADTIRRLCAQMATRLSTHCPNCNTPGFGQVDIEHGVPCSLCGEATQVIAADIHGCGNCSYLLRSRRPLQSADPTWCDSCNP